MNSIELIGNSSDEVLVRDSYKEDGYQIVAVLMYDVSTVSVAEESARQESRSD